MNKIVISILIVLIMVVLFACENSISEVQEIARHDTLTEVTAYDVEFERTDSGYLQVVLKSPVMNKMTGKNAYSEFPEGFEVQFFDTAQNAISFIRANYGINYEAKKKMIARNNVVVENFETGERLNTENLVWDQRKKQIVANTFVKITAPDRVVYGDSLNAHESFKNRTIYNVKAEFEFEDDTAVSK